MALALQQLSSLHLLAWLCTVHVGDDGRRRQESVRCLSDEGFISLQSFSLSLASQSVVPLRPSVGGAAQMNNDWGRFGAECVEVRPVSNSLSQACVSIVLELHFSLVSTDHTCQYSCISVND